MKENYLAIALGKKDVGESDRRYVFYTREEGLLYVKARGVRKPEAKLAAHTEDFMLSHIMIAKNYGSGMLAGAATENSFVRVRSDYDILCILDRVRLIFIRIMRTEQADLRVFTLFREFLEVLESGTNSPHAVSQCFLVKLFDLLGYRFPLSRCRQCHDVLLPVRNYFSPDRGGMICPGCARSSNESIPVDTDTLKLMRLISHHDLQALAKVQASSVVENQLQIITDHTAGWIMR